MKKRTLRLGRIVACVMMLSTTTCYPNGIMGPGRPGTFAAEQGLRDAQLSLGLAYAAGDRHHWRTSIQA
jgi:hypothetical protein